MDVNNFKTISLFGRIAYGVSCFENTITFLQYNVEDWKMVLKYLWEFSCIQYLDDWTGLLAEIIPENLLEFKTYEEHDYSYLDKKSYEYLYNLYQNIDEKIDFVMTAIFSFNENNGWGNKFDAKTISKFIV